MSQPPEVPPPSGRGTLVTNLLGQLFGYMDQPWKVLSVIGLLIVGGLGWLIWEERPLIRALITPGAPGPALLRVDVAADLEDLLLQTGADLISLWAVELGGTNTNQHLISARQRGGGAWSFRPQTVPAFQPGNNPQRLIAVWSGQPVCAAPEGQSSSLIVQRLATDGMGWLCVVPVATDSKPVIGALYLAWKNRPDQATEAANLSVAHEAAQRLVVR